MAILPHRVVKENLTLLSGDLIFGMTNVVCSSSCHCGDSCVNKPFQLRKVKSLKLSKTEKCGWGVEASEDIMAGEFLIEYVGEVIDINTCGERLCMMKEKGETNFYLVQMNHETIIDATYKGNMSRFINHSCLPNTILQKWQNDWETSAAVFALKNIKKGEFITYDYQWIQFGTTDQPCYCGEPNCKHFLGANHDKRKSLDEAIKVVIQEVILPRALKVSHTSANVNPKHRPHEAPGKELLLFRKKTDTAECIGLSVQVWSPLDQRFYRGKIVKYEPTSNKHIVVYDHGAQEAVDMAKMTWDFDFTVART